MPNIQYAIFVNIRWLTKRKENIWNVSLGAIHVILMLVYHAIGERGSKNLMKKAHGIQTKLTLKLKKKKWKLYHKKMAGNPCLLLKGNKSLLKMKIMNTSMI